MLYLVLKIQIICVSYLIKNSVIRF